MTNHGLFIGLVTLDLIYSAESPPQNNQKIVAADYIIAAGGPATNAAVAFSHLGNKERISKEVINPISTVLGVVGSHPMTQLIREDLQKYQVIITDLEPKIKNPPPVSSIIVTQASGERAVISINAVKTQANCEAIPADILNNVDIVLIDGHQMTVGIEIAQKAKKKNIPIVIDGGSWKLGFDKLLPFVDYAICSANFYPPHCQTTEDVFAYLSQFDIPHIAITHGEEPIDYFTLDQRGLVEVPKISAIDTVGAGDIFHGAFCHYILQENFLDALSSSAKIAAFSCQFFGTRRWMQD